MKLRTHDLPEKGQQLAPKPQVRCSSFVRQNSSPLVGEERWGVASQGTSLDVFYRTHWCRSATRPGRLDLADARRLRRPPRAGVSGPEPRASTAAGPPGKPGASAGCESSPPPCLSARQANLPHQGGGNNWGNAPQVSLPHCSPSARALGRLERGFTLIELLIVIIILGVLAALAVPRLAGRTEEARIQAAKADIEGGVGVALDLYEMDMGRYPASLEDLVAKPAAADRWKGPYLKKGRIPLDPWKNAYVYSFPASHNQSDYDLSSTGPDGMEGTEDDITNWSQ